MPRTDQSPAITLTKPISLQLTSPLFTDWDPQYVRLNIPGLNPAQPAELVVDGEPTPFQYTGAVVAAGAEVLVRLSFAKGQSRRLEFQPAQKPTTDLARVAVPLASAARVGLAGRELQLPPNQADHGPTPGPWAAFAGFPLASTVRCGTALVSRQLWRTNDGPLYTEYALEYRFAENRAYTVRLRCYRAEPIIEVSETFSLGMDAELEWTLNPALLFDNLLSHGPFEFGGDTQPTVEVINQERPRDVLCRLQMPPIGEFTIPNNRGWFAFFDSTQESRGMFGLLGLYGAQWINPVENIMRVSVAAGHAVLRASLRSGQRHWLLYAGPVEKGFRCRVSGVSPEAKTGQSDLKSRAGGIPLRAGPETRHLPPSSPDGRFVFHRLHAQFSALRLDEHFDLAGTAVLDASCWNKPGFFGENHHDKARQRMAAIPFLQKAAANESFLMMQALVNPTPAGQAALTASSLARFEKWVAQFQGYRENKGDYAKNVIGFARQLRREFFAYELLRKDGALSDDQLCRFHAYFVFAARRILDEGRWPHSKTWLHPDHPESTRDLYTYPGEHKPDRLIWTNCLPNFQSDPTCALLHLGALVPDHPDAAQWRQFALDDVERNLDAYCSPSGAWEESIGYTMHTLSYFIASFRILKTRFGIDYFQDPRLRRLVGWLVRFFGPYDKRFDSYTFPGIGNSSMPGLDGGLLLAYAGELASDDPLRADLLALYHKMAPKLTAHDESVFLPVAAMAPLPGNAGDYPLRPLASEVMIDLGVALRHGHPSPTESYLFQKIGFFKDHYECDETAFNWYAKGTPFCMEYGTYTADAAGGEAHNIVEIPDADSLRRGYLAETFLSPLVDFTRSEVPVTLKLLHGRLRTFAEIDGPPEATKFFYIGDENPVGPKVWKVRLLLFAKPDYVVIFDRVFGAVPHRFNLHVTGDDLRRDGVLLTARGRFDLDLRCFVQHPAQFELQTGQLLPGRSDADRVPTNPHRQGFFRIYNQTDGIYRTVFFAQERGRAVTLEPIGHHGVKIVTSDYTDYAFVNDEIITDGDQSVQFNGRVGWIRRGADGQVSAALVNGDRLAAFGQSFTGRGPWSYNSDGKRQLTIQGVPRTVTMT